MHMRMLLYVYVLMSVVTLVAYAVAFPRRALRPAFAWAVLALVLGWGVLRNVAGV